MPVTHELFVGLVTHRGSRFSDAVGPQGLLAGVAEALGARGDSVSCLVSDRDDWSAELVSLDKASVKASVDAELELEGRWHAYLAGRTLSTSARLGLMASRARRRLRYCPPWKRSLGLEDPGPRMVRRLVNIELSHMRVLQAAADSRCEWALIVEDDAYVPDASSFAAALAAFINCVNEADQPKMVSLSHSFTPKELGISELLTPADVPEVPWTLFRSERLVTNTVCAVLYRREFLQGLVEAMNSIPVQPVVPIDFKLNEALLTLASASIPGDCWFAFPGPIEQRSGVPEVRR